MTNFFRKLNRERLYKQWVENAGLPPEDLPPDLKKETGYPAESESAGMAPRREFRAVGSQTIDTLLNSRNMRFIGIMALIIVVLLIVLAVLATVLVMRSC
jgi:hypothetical protein